MPRPVRLIHGGARAALLWHAKRAATTLDHVPPKSIFLKPRPNDLVTVPSCFPCNNESSADDEEFRAFISLQAGHNNPLAHDLWKKGLIPTLGHNKRLKASILDRAEDVTLTTPAGILLGNLRALPLRAKPHNRVLKRIVRGLFYHHYGDVLHSQTVVEAKPIRNLGSEHADILQSLSLASVGGERFVYRYGRAHDSPQDSVWVMLFYRRYLVWGHSESAGAP